MSSFAPTNWRMTPANIVVVPALIELRDDRELLEDHLANLPDDKQRIRGQIDPHLAIARAKIEDAENFEEALSFLTTRESMAVLNSVAALQAVLAMPGASEIMVS